jgi:hypothetical protein
VKILIYHVIHLKIIIGNFFSDEGCLIVNEIIKFSKFKTINLQSKKKLKKKETKYQKKG